MSFDGSIVAALRSELDNRLKGARISKIAQTEKEELLITLKGMSGQERLLISVNPSLPVIYLTNENKPAPLTAPSFCMLLRKHIQSGKILSVTQPSMERIINIEIEHFNEMGDICRRILTVELMGRHSNIIFREGDRILDSIRHVSSLVSSVREVLPGRKYFIPFGDDKLDPFKAEKDEFLLSVCSGSLPLYKSLYTHVTGFSPQLAEEVSYNAGIEGERPAGSLTSNEQGSLYNAFEDIMSKVQEEAFSPCIIYENGNVKEFSAFTLDIYKDCKLEYYSSVSEMLKQYYSSRQAGVSIRQKTSDLRNVIQVILNRDIKKADLQKKQIKDTEKKDKYKTYGELLTAYGYSIEPKSTSFTTTDFYTGNEVTIPLDPTISAVENGKKFFEKYSKLKRTAESLNSIIEETEAEITHLESILASLDTVKDEADIAEIRREMSESGYIRSKGTGRKGNDKKNRAGSKSAPLHYISKDGFHMYVGKNNYQNEYITFKIADGGDWWFHARKRPGSHVIVKCEGKEVPDSTFEEAASLAAHYSKSDGESKIEVDYVQRKHVKKPGGSRPGFVIYHTNFSMYASGDISSISEAKK